MGILFEFWCFLVYQGDQPFHILKNLLNLQTKKMFTLVNFHERRSNKSVD